MNPLSLEHFIPEMLVFGSKGTFHNVRYQDGKKKIKVFLKILDTNVITSENYDNVYCDIFLNDEELQIVKIIEKIVISRYVLHNFNSSIKMGNRLRMKVPRTDDGMNIDLFLKDSNIKEEVLCSSQFIDKISPDMSANVVMELSGIWTRDGKVGCFWKLIQMRVLDKPFTFVPVVKIPVEVQKLLIEFPGKLPVLCSNNGKETRFVVAGGTTIGEIKQMLLKKYHDAFKVEIVHSEGYISCIVH